MHPIRVSAHILVAASRLCALAFLLVVVLLMPLVCGSPPDPTWFAGFYDDADGDDVVYRFDTMHLMSHMKWAGRPTDFDVSHALQAIVVVRYYSDRAPAIISRVALATRAPPLG